MTSTGAPSMIIVAGPNGAGKSTSGPALIRDVVELHNYINPDLIARGLAPLDPDSASFAAGRATLTRIAEHLKKHESFAFETTLSGSSYVATVRRAKERGFITQLMYLWVESSTISVSRVAERVRSGGHNIPEETIHRRYEAGVRNFFTRYRPVVDVWQLYNNSFRTGPLVVAEQDEHGKVSIYDKHLWLKLEQQYGK